MRWPVGSMTPIRATARRGIALRYLAACVASFDRTAISRHLSLLAVEVDGAKCASFLEEIQPHMLRMRSVQPVRAGSLAHRRLVLLDASFTDEGALPPPLRHAVEVIGGKLQRYDVRLSYEDLSVREALAELLPTGVPVPTAYESVGHVIHLNLRPEQLPHRHLIGQVLLDKLRPRVRTVVNKASEIHSQFRSIPLELVAGDDDYNVSVQHGSARLSFDYSKVYWSSRLHTEHERMASSFEPGQTVWDLFAGVGPFAVLAARRGTAVLANDLNPDACKAMLHNVRQNHVMERVHVYNLDAAAFVTAATASLLCREPALSTKRLRALTSTDDQQATIGTRAATLEQTLPDHILLNLPSDSLRFLAVLRTLRDVPGANPMVHCYSFSKLEGSDAQLREAQERVAAELGYAPAQLAVRDVRSVAPGKLYLCYSFRLAAYRVDCSDPPSALPSP